MHTPAPDSNSNTGDDQSPVGHYLAVRIFEDDFDIKDGQELQQFDGSAREFARHYNATHPGSEATWYEVVDLEIGDGLLSCRYCGEKIYGVVCRSDDNEAAHWGCSHMTSHHRRDSCGGNLKLPSNA